MSGGHTEAKKIARELERRGWAIKEGKHYKCYPPAGGALVVMSKTPGRGRALQNIHAMIRRVERAAG